VNYEKWEGAKPPGAYIVRKPPGYDLRFSDFEDAAQKVIESKVYTILIDPLGDTLLIKGEPSVVPEGVEP
jgi:hypothetical protein